MRNLEITDAHSASPQLKTTLWHCSLCNAVVSIYSAHMLLEAFCPACGAAMIEFPREFNSIPGIQFGDA